jgi:hypothetical protein
VEEQLGTKYVQKRTIPFETSYEETGIGTPVFFVLSPGVDPLKDVEAVGKKLNFTLTKGNLHNVSLGQVDIHMFNGVVLEPDSLSFCRGKKLLQKIL